MEKGIVVAGTGGQGIVAAGEFLAEALFRAGYEVINSRSYGSEARGGSCRSEVLFSDSDIYDLQLDEADILVILSIPAFRRYQNRAKKDALILVDAVVLEKLGESEVRTDVKLVPVKARETAIGLGNPIVANMVLLGALARHSDILSLEDMQGVVREMMRVSMQEININALESGYSQA